MSSVPGAVAVLVGEPTVGHGISIPATPSSGGTAGFFNVTDYWSGSGSWTSAFQAAIDAAMAVHGTVVIPGRAGGYNIDDTLVIDGAATSGQACVNFIAGGGNWLINWTGADSKSVFHTYGWRKSSVHGVTVGIPATADNVTVWDIDTNASATSSSAVSFYDCQVGMFSGATGTIGWRLGHGRASGDDISGHNWFNCVVSADAAASHYGWVNEGNNSVAHQWHGGGGSFLQNVFTNISLAGAAAPLGGSGCYFYGFQTSHNVTDFAFSGGGSFMISGGRFETGTTFISGPSNTGQSVVIGVEGVTVSTYTGPVFDFANAANVTVDNSSFYFPADIGTGLIHLATPDQSRLASFAMSGCNIVGSTEPFYVSTSPWQIRLLGNMHTNTSDQTTTRVTNVPPDVSASYAHTVLSTPNLISYWRLGEAVGSLTAADVMQANPGTYGTTTHLPTLGVKGALYDTDTAITFDGTTDYVVFADGASIQFGDTFTVEMWFKRGAIGAQYRLWTHDATAGLAIYFDASNFIECSKVGTGTYLTSANAITDTASWHHLACTKNGASSAKIYVDGVDQLGTFNNQTITNAAGGRFIGYNVSASWVGSIDEVAIYSRALSATEVAAHYGAR